MSNRTARSGDADNRCLRVAVAGLGTVGGGVVRLLETNAAELAQRAGRPVRVVAISGRDRQKKRDFDPAAYEWHDDATRMAATAPADVVVELIGGRDGPALSVCRAALAAGRHLVTANKAMLASHGLALARQAEQDSLGLGYEAAVAGGVPVVRALRDGLAGNRIDNLYGILNGTCNYILSEMRASGRPFGQVLADAQQQGYAEADPHMDVDGIDAAQKLALLSSLAFGTPPDGDKVFVEGIRHIAPEDIAFAERLGYRIKLLGIARRTGDGLEQRVHPCLVPADDPVARVDGVENAVSVTGDFVGTLLFQGAGAGAGPTASAVASDLLDIARGMCPPAFSVPADRLNGPPVLPMAGHRGSCYVRLTVLDRPGAIAGIAGVFRDEAVSIGSLLQHGRSMDGGGVTVVLTTHTTGEAAMLRAVEAIGQLPFVVAPPRMIRVETLS